MGPLKSILSVAFLEEIVKLHSKSGIGCGIFGSWTIRDNKIKSGKENYSTQ